MHKNQLHIVTDYCEEGDLFTQIRNRKAQGVMYTETEIMNSFIQLANGLQHIHSKRILHRDLKTQNIFIARGGVLKLGDLGIARVLEGTHDMASTVTGSLLKPLLKTVFLKYQSILTEYGDSDDSLQC